MLAGNLRKLRLTDATRLAFPEVESVLTKNTFLVHLVLSVASILAVEALDCAIRAVMQQLVSDIWDSLGFFLDAFALRK